jgi:hypothetical protein
MLQHNDSPLTNASRPKIPRAELKKLIDVSFAYERRKFIFWSFNTTYLVLQTITNLRVLLCSRSTRI